MQLLLQDGSALAAPRPITDEAAGAEALAALYAPGPGLTVRAMMNTTIDGAVTGSDGSSGTLRNADDSLVFAVLRSLADVVLVGAGTVRAEYYTQPAGHPALDPRAHRPGGAGRPELAVLTTTGDLPEELLGDSAGWPVLALCPPEHRDRVIERSGLDAERVLPAADAAEAVDQLAARGHRLIQAEGGPGTLGRLAAVDRLDELCFSTTHRTVGGDAARVITGAAAEQDWRLASLLVGAEATIGRYRRA